MKQYHELLKKILEDGTKKPAARENMPGTISLFGAQMEEFDLQKGFPILTTKKINFEHIITELLWFLRGDTNVKYLNENGCKIWNEDSYNYYKKVVINGKLSYEEYLKELSSDSGGGESVLTYELGSCGYQYGKVWRDFGGVDQIYRVIQGLKDNPESRRHIVTAMDPANDDKLALYWCHNMFQFNARPMNFQDRTVLGDHYLEYEGDFDEWLENESSEEDVIKIMDENNVPKYYLDCKMYQRSADVFLGVPYNITSYALLTHFIARIVNMEPGKYIHTFGDVHIYDNHIDQVNKILENDLKKYSRPNLVFAPRLGNLIDKFNGESKINGSPDFGYKEDFDSFIHNVEIEDIYLDDYQSYPFIKAKLSTGLK